jgi:hypothetical protein
MTTLRPYQAGAVAEFDRAVTARQCNLLCSNCGAHRDHLSQEIATQIAPTVTVDHRRKVQFDLFGTPSPALNPDRSVKGCKTIYAPQGQAGEYAALACNPLLIPQHHGAAR